MFVKAGMARRGWDLGAGGYSRASKCCSGQFITIVITITTVTTIIIIIIIIIITSLSFFPFYFA